MDPHATREINGHTYQVTLYPTDLGLLWQDRLMRIGLEPVAIMMVDVGALARQNALSESDGLGPERSPMAVAVRVALERLGAQKLNVLIRDLFKGCVALIGPDGTPQLLVRQTAKGAEATELYETTFRGNLWELYQVLQFLLEANFRDFIEGVLSSVGARQRRSQIDSLVSAAEKSARAGEKDAMAEALEQIAHELAAMLPAEPEA